MCWVHIAGVRVENDCLIAGASVCGPMETEALSVSLPYSIHPLCTPAGKETKQAYIDKPKEGFKK